MQIKICCIQSIDEGILAIKHGADILGLVGPMPSGPGVLSLDEIEEISGTLNHLTKSFLLTSAIQPDDLIKEVEQVKPDALQLVDKVDVATYAILKERFPKLELVQVIHVLDENSIEEAKVLDDLVDAILLDSGNPNKKTKVLGGTGKKHDWSISKKIVEQSNLPVFLAGGLNSENVKDAISQVKPFGVDLCSGVRTNGKLDVVKLKSFIENVRACERN